MSSLADINEEYEQIMRSPEGGARDRNLSQLMNKMKHDFHIPPFQSDEWEQNNKDVITLYRKISMSRSK
ncbi:hypothetical protein NZD89_28845 (plasmid) [Alicyclobacillus fastidiosus]|uniref:Uncharacterized protein n=1 Tax=Alicyclobacillus fastidiosus TaxID=392011 RepID=A0ABY6ZPT8_9BACL|nr:hypothetical protein [Alicyclobacillus fastidiosus]WAH44993.1 hypothetical protein NZD89_28845 [Alicyclobacillus fastidiosus]GMA66262.1 hypothetical protein GCM10025859_67040 [Alicyclobacillus fastidiosus]GMA66311.1 hypothetical protein GCM10025859_67530 [Alicyclobacillus fastidiosus]